MMETATMDRKMHPNKQSGVTLIELLITMILIAIGLLGYASLQLKIQQASFDAYQRTQALILVNDMVDRIQANRYSSGCYAFTITAGAPFLGDSSGSGHLGTPSCSGFGTAETQAIAEQDMNEWNDLLIGAYEVTEEGENQGGILNARGCVSLDTTTTPETFTIAVAWQGPSDTTAPTVDCGNGLYGSETARRVVSTTMQMATLL